MLRVRARSAVGLVGVLLASTALAGCAAGGDRAPSHLVVRIAPSPEPAAYEVRLAQARGPFRAVHTMRSGETRRFSVPAGWVTVRIPGLCVVPTSTAQAPTVEVRHDDCEVA